MLGRSGSVKFVSMPLPQSTTAGAYFIIRQTNPMEDFKIRPSCDFAARPNAQFCNLAHLFPFKLARFFTILLLVAMQSWAFAESDFDAAPINYSTTTANDAVTELGQDLANGKATFEWDSTHGWLPSLLEHLKVP
ncbi:MAG: hypothetical protein AAF497_13320, partial [Planctomycetota bacterium]